MFNNNRVDILIGEQLEQTAAMAIEARTNLLYSIDYHQIVGNRIFSQTANCRSKSFF